MPVVWIPSLLRGLTGGQERLTVPGRTVRQVIEELERRFPGIQARLCDADDLRPGIAVAVDTQVARRGLGEPVAEQSEVHFLPAVSGGELQLLGILLQARTPARYHADTGRKTEV
jgi:molybdopterin synthase sulfur carrier subunit